MTRWQVLRFGGVALAVATVQTAALERFLLFGVGSLVLPVWLAIAVGRRLPATNAAAAGFWIGLTWDALSVDLFGRYALALAAIAAFASHTGGLAATSGRVRRFIRRLVVVALATVWLWAFSALVGETLPIIGWSSLAGLVLVSWLGAAFTGPGSRLERMAIPGRTAWDEPDRSTSWVDRRAGLFPVAVRPGAEPEAA